MPATERLMGAYIPFTGFYYTILTDEVEYDVRYYFDDGNGYVAEDKAKVYDDVAFRLDYHSIYEEIAKLYASWFSQRFDYDMFPYGSTSGIEFCALESPAYYNFETDRIRVSLPESVVRTLERRARAETDGQTWEQYVREALEPRDGFIPHYSNLVEDWGDVGTWDAVQVGLLISYLANHCYCLSYGDTSQCAMDFIEDYNDRICNVVWSRVEEILPEIEQEWKELEEETNE